jgi:hypothetical protein
VIGDPAVPVGRRTRADLKMLMVMTAGGALRGNESSGIVEREQQITGNADERHALVTQPAQRVNGDVVC